MLCMRHAGNASGAGGAMRAGLARWPALLWVRELVGIPVMELALHVCVAYPSIRWVVSLLGPAAAVLAVQRCVVVLVGGGRGWRASAWGDSKVRVGSMARRTCLCSPALVHPAGDVMGGTCGTRPMGGGGVRHKRCWC